MFISEHLTKGASSIFFEARTLVKEKRLAAAWTFRGLVNVKFTTDPQEKPTVVRSVSGLVRTQS